MKFLIKRKLFVLSSLLLIFTVISCSTAKDGAKSPYEQSKINDENNTAATYDRFVAGIGQSDTDYLISEIGVAQLDLLSYGAGTSNMITLVNMIPDLSKLIAMIGSDYPVGSETGLGAARTVKLLNRVDYWMQQNKYTGSVPSSQDTIQRLGDFINGIPDAATITSKVVNLVNAMAINRDLSDTTEDPESDETRIDRLAKLISHSTDVSNVLTVMNSLSAVEVTGKLANLLLGLTLAEVDNLVESMDYITDASRMVSLIQGVTDINKIITVMAGMNPRCSSKLAYAIDNVTNVATLITLMENMTNVSRMSDIINEMEDNTTWTGQVGGAQNWAASYAPSDASDSGMPRLVAIMNGLATDPNPAKLVQIMDNVADMTKMMMIIQDVTNVADMVTLISGFPDPGTNAVPVQNLAYVMNNVSVANMARMRELVDGQRINSNVGDQTIYLGKLVDLISALDNAKEGPLKVAELIDGVSDIDKIIDLTYDVTTLSNLSDVINDINKGSLPSPNQTAVITLIYMVENIADISKMVSIIDDVTPANVASLVNNVASGSQLADDGSTEDLEAAGKKLNNVINGTTTISNLVFIMNEVSDFSKMANIINSLKIASTPKMADLVNNVTGANVWNAASPDVATGQGKMVNMIDNIGNTASLATMIDEILVAAKLYGFVNQVTNSSLIVSLVNKVDENGLNVNVDQMVGMMNGIAVGDIPKLSSLITELNGTEDQLVADLLAPISVRDQGVGYDNMVTLITDLNDTAAAVDLATVMMGLNSSLSYLGGTVMIREGMVRMLIPDNTSGGVTYLGQNFPGIGPVHMAVMMNSADDPNDLVALLNSLGLDQMIPMIGCGDAVGDPGHDGVGPFAPDFYTPCTAVGMGW